MTVSRSVLVRLRAEMAQFKREWGEGTDAVKKAREELGKADRQSKKTSKSIAELDSVVARTSARLKGHRQEWDQVGSSLLRTGAVIAATGVLMGKAAMDWETAWTGVLKTVDGTPEQLADVEAGIRDLAKSMPESHKNIAAVAEAAGQLGVATENVVDFTRVMVMLGDTTNLSADEAATSIAQLMNVMQTAPEDVNRVGAALVDLGNKGASTERDIIQMAQRIAGAGEIVGLTEANVLALANALASSGIEVEAGGSAISKVLIDISKAVSTGSDQLKTLANVSGVTASQFAARWKAAPAAALTDFTEGLGRMAANGEDVFTTLDNLGQSDVRVTRALLNMANAGDMLRQSIADGNRAWDENNALVEEARKRYDTTAAEAQMAWNNIKDNAIDAGQGILPIVSALSDVVTALGSTFGALPGPIQGSLGVLALFTGGALLAVGGLMKAAGAVSDFRDALRTLEIRAPRTGRALGLLAKGFAAVTAAAVAGDALERWDEIDVAGVNEYTKALLQAADGSDKLLQSLTTVDSSKLLGIFSNRNYVDGLKDAFEQASKAGGFDWSFGHEDSAERAAKMIRQIDSGLASLVQSGSAETAAAAMDTLRESTGRTTDELLEKLPAYKDALAGVDNQQELTAGSAGELDDAASALDRRLAELGGGEDAEQLLKELTDASTDAAMGFLDLSNKIDPAKASLNAWLTDLEKQAKAMDQWADNMIKATARGVDRGVIAKFEQMGPEGAKRLAELVNGSQKNIDRLNKVWGDATEGAFRYADALQGIPANVLTEFKTPGAKDAIATAIEVVDQYNLAPDQVKTILEALDYASEDIEKVLDSLQVVDDTTAKPRIDVDPGNAFGTIDTVQQRINDMRGRTLYVSVKPSISGSLTDILTGAAEKADGGPITGVGGPKQDNILVAASAGEHMWTAREVDNVGGHGAVYAMRAMARAGKRPRYAEGGAVADAWDQSFRSAAASFGAPVPSVAASPAVVAGASGPSHFTGDLYLDSGEWLGAVRGIARAEVSAGTAQAARTAGTRARRGGR